MSALTSNAVANQALQLIGDNQPAITGSFPNFDSSAAGIAMANIYPWAVRTVGRQNLWDFARAVAALALTANVAPLGFAFEYAYPASAVQLVQLMPQALADSNNPLPIDWTVGNTLVVGVQTKVIWTNLASAQAIFSVIPDPSVWDPGAQEAIVRLIASELAVAIAGRLDTAQSYLESSSQIGATMAERTD
jgi:hypothetical protein